MQDDGRDRVTYSHADLTRNDRKGFASACPGEAREVDRFPDLVLDGGGRVVQRTVVLALCRGCSAAISRDAATGEVLNVYRRDDPPPSRQERAALLGTSERLQ